MHLLFVGMLSTYGFDQLSSPSGMYSYPADTWGPTFAPVKELTSNLRSASTASSDYAEWPLPNGARSAVLNYIAWGDGSSVDVMGVNSAGAEIWRNRIAWGQFSTTVLASERHSGEQIQVVANQLHEFTHIKLRVVKGTARIQSISFVAFDLPTASCSFSPSSDSLSDSRDNQKHKPRPVGLRLQCGVLGLQLLRLLDV